ncbi:DNA-binding protein, partial [Campylobacter jejuni]|nr:DNA-binding protein [Campylobacter jejuni]
GKKIFYEKVKLDEWFKNHTIN